MQTTAIAIQKGGSGKTTTAIHLAAGLAKAGAKVLAVDMDPQFNLSQGLGISHYIEPSESVYTCILEGTKPETVIQQVHGLDLLPGCEEMAALERLLTADPIRTGGMNALKKVLKPLERKYDYCIIDCPPSLGLLTFAALAASDSVIMPLVPEFFPIRGAGLFYKNIQEIRKSGHNSALSLSGVLLTKYDPRKVHHSDVAAALGELFPGLVYDTHIRQNIALAEAAGNGLPVYDYDPSSNGAKDYSAFVKEFIQRSMA